MTNTQSPEFDEGSEDSVELSGHRSSHSSGSFIRHGSNRNWAETGRTKLQKERQRIHQEINREIQIRAGAERLFRATNSRRHHEKIAAELAVVNANLQILSEEMAELNTSVHVYQDQIGECVPMIPLGLKETVDIDFADMLTDFLSRHYHVENVEDFQGPIGLFMSLRDACRSPSRDDSGLRVILEYVHTLSLVEKRFFTPKTDIRFTWYDSLSGRPATQRSVAFEKASMLFNVGALYTQIGARQRSSSIQGLSEASVSFEKATGIFQFVASSFNNAPSTDLRAETLSMLGSLMLAQSQECVYELSLLSDTSDHLLHSQEAAQVSKSFLAVHDNVSSSIVKKDVPYPWISLVLVKVQFYKATSHYHLGLAVIESETSKDDLQKCLEPTSPDSVISSGSEGLSRRSIARSHVRQATLLLEECIRIHRMCRLLRKVDTLLTVLTKAHDKSLSLYQRLEEEDNFESVSRPANVIPKTRKVAKSIPPDLARFKIKDSFHQLGPLNVFNASTELSKPRVVHLKKDPNAPVSFGFSVRGSSPVSVTDVELNSIAEKAGLRKGDYIVGLNEENVRWELHENVVQRMKDAGSEMTLMVVTPSALLTNGTEPVKEAVKTNGHKKGKN
ncbi:hypothetical protein RvY_18549 [Ramazzottius varieornatus]|uniref:PDZ domain-containing protein n=1 Tax=Ramazzottius varieornatus TaxID=947166 RepID=A0A1D1W663_RAMVA|nr:hypothetical protein RvY_18549 [Ramazzottius varieornatus]